MSYTLLKNKKELILNLETGEIIIDSQVIDPLSYLVNVLNSGINLDTKSE